MTDFRQCEFFLLRYVPDVVKGEFVNVGVVLLEDGGDGFTDVRFTRDWRRVRCLDPEVDVELLESYEAELRRLLQSRLPEVINYRGPLSRREWLLAQMEQSFSGALELAPMTAVLTESPAAELGKLAQAYLESAARGRRTLTGRRMIYTAMRDAFEQTGVWPLMWKDIAVAQYQRSMAIRSRSIAPIVRRVSSTCSTRFRWRPWWIRRRCWRSAIRIFATGWRRRRTRLPTFMQS